MGVGGRVCFEGLPKNAGGGSVTCMGQIEGMEHWFLGLKGKIVASKIGLLMNFHQGTVGES